MHRQTYKLYENEGEKKKSDEINDQKIKKTIEIRRDGSINYQKNEGWNKEM